MSIACGLILALLPAAAGAQIDPPAGSPAGKVYELPVDKGRSDGAPRGGGSSGASSTTGGPLGEGSFYRSENNFGTSSRVPGDPKPPKDDATGPGERVEASPAADLGNPEEGRAIALLGVIAAAGIGVGLLSRRSWGS